VRGGCISSDSIAGGRGKGIDTESAFLVNSFEGKAGSIGFGESIERMGIVFQHIPFMESIHRNGGGHKGISLAAVVDGVGRLVGIKGLVFPFLRLNRSRYVFLAS